MFVPGEICTLFGYRAEAYIRDLGYDAGIIVGFANDHEGYFMTIIEDWLAGGYEPGINIWVHFKPSTSSRQRCPSPSAALKIWSSEPMTSLFRLRPLSTRIWI